MKIGFIGCGNMGSSIMDGIIKAGIVKNTDIYVSDANSDYLKKTAAEKGVNSFEDNKEIAKLSDIIFLCVKPNVISKVAEEIASCCHGKIIVSIAAGVQLCTLESYFGTDAEIVRVMPNTPALVGEGMCGICSNLCGGKAAEKVKELLLSIGKAQIVTENLMDAVTAVSGSSPALVFMLIEAMADSGVQGGMTRADANMFAAQAVLGSAKMVLETGKHPDVLKDMVCSPKGTTIDMVASLEKSGFRSSIIEALKVCREKSESMH